MTLLTIGSPGVIVIYWIPAVKRKNLLKIFKIYCISIVTSSLLFGFIFSSVVYAQTPTTSPWEVPISICDPARGSFSANINNNYFNYPVGLVQILENSTSKLQISVLNETQVIAGVTTRVVEEREWTYGSLTKVSKNFFAAASDSTVCYFGKDAKDGNGNQIPGSWQAGVNGALPGVMMPAYPVVGNTYYQEYAPADGVTDRSLHKKFESSFATSGGTYSNVLLIYEDPTSTKRYAPGIGLIYKDGMMLKSRSVNTEVTTTPPTLSPGTASPTPTTTVTGTATSPLLGDLDGDRDIDIRDSNILVNNYGSKNCGNIADINKDCKVNLYDYNILLNSYDSQLK